MNSAAPPIPPPKPSTHEPSRNGTPLHAASPQHQHPVEGVATANPANAPSSSQPHQADIATRMQSEDPGDQWLPKILENKSKQELTDILSNPTLLNALTHSPDTIHGSLAESHQALRAALAENMDLAHRLLELESHLAQQRSTTQAQLLSTHALERQWRQKQADMDHALSPFSPASLYQSLSHGVQEQASVCHAMEESFLEDQADGSPASEREALDWVKRYREAKVLYYLRQERKSRWDEGRVGGWR